MGSKVHHYIARWQDRRLEAVKATKTAIDKEDAEMKRLEDRVNLCKRRKADLVRRLGELAAAEVPSGPTRME